MTAVVDITALHHPHLTRDQPSGLYEYPCHHHGDRQFFFRFRPFTGDEDEPAWSDRSELTWDQNRALDQEYLHARDLWRIARWGRDAKRREELAPLEAAFGAFNDALATLRGRFDDLRHVPARRRGRELSFASRLVMLGDARQDAAAAAVILDTGTNSWATRAQNALNLHCAEARHRLPSLAEIADHHDINVIARERGRAAADRLQAVLHDQDARLRPLHHAGVLTGQE